MIYGVFKRKREVVIVEATNKEGLDEYQARTRLSMVAYTEKPKQARSIRNSVAVGRKWREVDGIEDTEGNAKPDPA